MSSHTETPTQLPPLPADGLRWSEHPELDAGGLKTFAAGRLAAFKVPSRVEVRAALPTNATGKIFKQPLRERFGYWAAGG
jgi:acyl-CoA synthetase (AMP-forming)/AMP-acid ligase II